MISLNIDKSRALLAAIETINGDDQLFLQILQAVEGQHAFGKDQVKEFIDRVFADPICLKKAWDTPGFPFISLNDIYKSITEAEHPVFVELFGHSFISGTYQVEEEKQGSCGHFSLLGVKYYGVAPKKGDLILFKVNPHGNTYVAPRPQS